MPLYLKRLVPFFGIRNFRNLVRALTVASIADRDPSDGSHGSIFVSLKAGSCIPASRVMKIMEPGVR